MELNLDNIAKQQYCDLQTIRRSIQMDVGPFYNPNFRISDDPVKFDTEMDGPIYNEIYETYDEYSWWTKELP